ncbi:MAG: hypothetical protein KGD67_12170, partial [Candidatus Lokiarchaeota archaeon]|nr:hypothetical protein [Candidatus Lokiarchaeota archaeon]
IDCNDGDFIGYGFNAIIVNASKQYYYNQSKSVTIKRLGETELTILNPPDLTVFNSGDTFNLTILYNDTVKNQGIDGATIDYQLDPSASYKSINVVPLGNGYYNITFNCNDADFSYGPNTIEVNAEKTYYNNQSKSIANTILAETELTILNPPDLTVFNSGDTFNLTVLYNDTVKNQGIDGATIDYQLDPSAS